MLKGRGAEEYRGGKWIKGDVCVGLGKQRCCGLRGVVELLERGKRSKVEVYACVDMCV